VKAGIFRPIAAALDILAFNTRRSLALLGDRGRRGFALRRLLGGVNFVQYLEFQLILDHLDLSGRERVLDVASPKLLAAYLAASGRVAQIHLTDLADPRLADFAALVPPEAMERVVVRQLDATALDRTEQAASFDRVYSLTSLQHFAGDGDREAMRQFARVLVPGGRLLITVPYGPRWVEEPYLDGARKRYDEAAIAERLAAPELELVERIYYGERWFPIDSAVSALPRATWQVFINWMTPAIQPLFWVPCPPEQARGVALVYRRTA
jgi:SAM-dependent methyltransferase